MPILELPPRRIVALQEVATRLLDSRRSELDIFARDLLNGFQQLCMQSGIDGILVELGVGAEEALGERTELVTALVAQLKAIEIDGGGPRNAKPRQCAESVVAALGLTIGTGTERDTVVFGDDVRLEVEAAVARIFDVELAVPRIRDVIVGEARKKCEEQHQGSFARIEKHLDERGMRLQVTPKVPLDALHAIQRLLADTRNAVIERAGRRALDQIVAIIAKTDADAAARIDQPITHKLTPRDVAIRRAQNPLVLQTPAAMAKAFIDGLLDLAQLAWRAAERTVRAYSPRETFAVGELVEHPKFGRGTVIAVDMKRVEADFPDGKYTLVHARPA